MNQKYIDIGNNKWGILLFWDFDMMDWDDMAAVMYAFGMERENVNKSIRILSSHNSGMTVSSDDLRMSAVFIGNATSNSQFWNSIAHECAHLVDAISDYYQVESGTEEHAYLQGYIFQRIVEEVARPCF